MTEQGHPKQRNNSQEWFKTKHTGSGGEPWLLQLLQSYLPNTFSINSTKVSL